jgi:glycosyltransferase involved in cell wall biosynthesis
MIYHRLSLGGIEAHIVRSANFFVDQGHLVTIFTRPGSMTADLDKRVYVVHFDQYKEVCGWIPRKKELNIILAFDPLTYMVMKKLQWRIYRSTGVKTYAHSGLFHPRTLAWPGDPVFVRWINKAVFNLAQDSDFYFMSEAVKRATVKIVSQRRVESTKIITVPLDIPTEFSPVKRPTATQLSIVSVGRIVPFKAYNHCVPEIVSKLLSLGVDVSWEIWGDGDDLQMIEKLILEYGVQEHVKLKGSLPYSEFKATVTSANLFVGMGTAAVEAAILGVPTICCVEQLDDACYGFLSDAPLDAIGEQVENFSYQKISDVISLFSTLSVKEIEELSVMSREAAIARVGKSDYNSLLDAPLGPIISASNYVALLVAAPYLWAVDSRKSRFFFKRLRRILG